LKPLRPGELVTQRGIKSTTTGIVLYRVIDANSVPFDKNDSVSTAVLAVLTVWKVTVLAVSAVSARK